MRAIPIITAILICFSTAVFAAQDNKEIQIKLGMTYSDVNSALGNPAEERLTAVFWGGKKALYKIGKNDYAIVEYLFNRAKNILFLQQVSEEEALQKFKSPTVK